MHANQVSCLCGDIKLELTGEPLFQFYCHCDDCQAVNGAAYISVAIFPSDAVHVVQGEPVPWTYKTLPRQHCSNCGTQLFAQPTGANITGVKANLLPAGQFKPAYHIYCEYAALPVQDDLPHYKTLPPELGGNEEVVDW